MDNVSTEAIEYRYQEVKRPAGVDVADINMPFLVDFRWLNEACAFLAGGHAPTAKRPACLRTRYVELGITATMSSSSIMKVNRQ